MQCKSEPSYNSVVQKAIESDQKQRIEEPTSIVKDEEILIDTMNQSDPIVEIVQKVELPVSEAKNEVEQPIVSKKKSRAKIVFDEYMFEFEDIAEGDVVEHKFYFTNTGVRELSIKSTKATCGCTIPSYPFIPIEPGGRGFIGVTFNSIGKSGKQTPSITVVSNAEEPIVKLRLKGNVTNPDDKTSESPQSLPE